MHTSPFKVQKYHFFLAETIARGHFFGASEDNLSAQEVLRKKDPLHLSKIGLPSGTHDASRASPTRECAFCLHAFTGVDKSPKNKQIRVKATRKMCLHLHRLSIKSFLRR